jgi:hypothetical protein
VIGSPTIGPSDEEVYEHLAVAAKCVLDKAVDEAQSLASQLEIVGELVEVGPRQR